MKRQLFRLVSLLLLVALMATIAFSAEEEQVHATLIDSTGVVLESYETLELALAAAGEGDVVRLEQDVVMTQNVTVPAGVTLLLPCVDQDPGYMHRTHDSQDIWFNQDGTSTDGKIGIGPYAYNYRLLKISEGVTLTVEGTVMVNAVTGRPSGGHHDMDVTGGYAQIDLAGEIVVKDGGILENFGFVKGDGLVTVENGGTVGDLFIVRNWRGGTLGEKMYAANVYPMNESDCRNIESDIRVEYGGSLVGLVKMSATLTTAPNYYYTRFPQVDVNNGLIRLTNENGYVLRSYDSANEREIFELHGGAEFAHTSLNILGMDLSTSSYIYPIDGDTEFTLADGDYAFVNDYKVLTGATVAVKGDATLTVADRATGLDADGVTSVVFYDEFHDIENTDHTEYPELPAATLTLENGAEFFNAGVFAGTIVTEEANVSGDQDALWTMQTKEARGYALSKPYVVVLSFDLQIHREGYVWTMDETDGNIVWHAIEEEQKDTADVQQTVTPQENTNLLVIEGMLFNTSGETIDTEYLLVALYDSADKLLSLGMKEVEKLYNGSAVTYRFSLKGAEGCSARVFVLGQGFVPALTK